MLLGCHLVSFPHFTQSASLNFHSLHHQKVFLVPFITGNLWHCSQGWSEGEHEFFIVSPSVNKDEQMHLCVSGAGATRSPPRRRATIDHLTRAPEPDAHSLVWMWLSSTPSRWLPRDFCLASRDWGLSPSFAFLHPSASSLPSCRSQVLVHVGLAPRPVLRAAVC